MLSQELAKSPCVTSVGIRPNSSILSVLAHLNYKAWFAVAEFVDNSIQSYISNKEVLRVVHGEKFRLKIRVRLDLHNQLIEITDNAAGIRGADFPRAFKPAEVPADRTGLSEFGMGMKTAACWFTNTWSVRSKALGEPVERLIRFDLNAIVGSKLDNLPVIETQVPEDQHYTVLRLENLGKKFPVNRTQKKLRDHLASIYRVYLRSGEIEIYFDEDKLPLQHNEPEVMVAPPYASPNALPVYWRKNINFEMGKNRRVFGFAALRAEGSTTHAGFSLLRRNRLILGSDDETYRPQEIFGNSNSYRFQRLCGELNLEGVDVSHTKDGFVWDDFEEEFLQKLRDNLREAPLDLLSQAENFRVRPSKTVLQPVLKKAGQSIVSDMVRTGAQALSNKGATQAILSASEPFIPVTLLIASESRFSLLVDDQIWNVLVRTSIDPAVTEMIRVSKTERQQIDHHPINDIEVDVSMAHPFIRQYIGPKNENVELFLRLSVAIALSAEKSSRAGYPVRFAMHWLNQILRECLPQGGK